MAIASSLSSVNARLFAFARQLKSRGHHVLIAGPNELDQVWLSAIDVIMTMWTGQWNAWRLQTFEPMTSFLATYCAL